MPNESPNTRLLAAILEDLDTIIEEQSKGNENSGNEKEVNVNERKDMIRVVIWGAGEHGQRILFHIGEENVEAFIDNNSSKQHALYCGIKVISFEKYLERYNEYIIILSTHSDRELVRSTVIYTE